MNRDQDLLNFHRTRRFIVLIGGYVVGNEGGYPNIPGHMLRAGRQHFSSRTVVQRRIKENMEPGR